MILVLRSMSLQRAAMNLFRAILVHMGRSTSVAILAQAILAQVRRHSAQVAQRVSPLLHRAACLLFIAFARCLSAPHSLQASSLGGEAFGTILQSEQDSVIPI
jgi:hypothetical protein